MVSCFKYYINSSKSNLNDLFIPKTQLIYLFNIITVLFFKIKKYKVNSANFIYREIYEKIIYGEMINITTKYEIRIKGAS